MNWIIRFWAAMGQDTTSPRLAYLLAVVAFLLGYLL